METIGNSLNIDPSDTGSQLLIPTIEEFDNNIVCGEFHNKEEQSPVLDEKFDDSLESLNNENSIIVLEHDPDNSGWPQNEERWMKKAKAFSDKKSFPKEYLDDESTLDSFKIWNKLNVPITQDEYDYLRGLSWAFDRFSKGKQLSSLSKEISDNKFLTKDRKKSHINGINRFSEKLNSMASGKSDSFKEVTNAIRTFNTLDAQCREIYYQAKIAQIMKENPDKKLFIVVGNSHAEGVLKTIKDPKYRNSNPTKGVKLSFQLSDLKN